MSSVRDFGVTWSSLLARHTCMGQMLGRILIFRTLLYSLEDRTLVRNEPKHRHRLPMFLAAHLRFVTTFHTRSVAKPVF